MSMGLPVGASCLTASCPCAACAAGAECRRRESSSGARWTPGRHRTAQKARRQPPSANPPGPLLKSARSSDSISSRSCWIRKPAAVEESQEALRSHTPRGASARTSASKPPYAAARPCSTRTRARPDSRTDACPRSCTWRASPCSRSWR
eukprot:4386874-Pyramimonas_sp.AAC.1